MKLDIYKDHETLSAHVADEVLALVKKNPDAVLCLAAGDTPRLACSMIVRKAMSAKVDFSRCTFVGLDEWVGIPPENEGSCHFFLHSQLFKPLAIADDQINLFDALSRNLEVECGKMNKLILQKGGIDLMIVGVGMNGHIGFNEPGVEENLYAHIVPLDATTQSVGQKYFKKSTVLTKGITLGLRHLLESKQAIVIASGIKKAEILRRALEDEISTKVPASVIRKHKNGLVMLDEAAASLLKNGY